MSGDITPPAVRKQQSLSACENIIFSFSDTLLNGNFGEYVFMACERAGRLADFFLLFNTKGTRGCNLGLILSLCFPAFSFSAAGKKRVAGSCIVSAVLLTEHWRCCLGTITGNSGSFLLRGLQVSRCAGPLRQVPSCCIYSPICISRCFSRTPAVPSGSLPAPPDLHGN